MVRVRDLIKRNQRQLLLYRGYIRTLRRHGAAINRLSGIVKSLMDANRILRRHG
jgi:hypothetical protein